MRSRQQEFGERRAKRQLLRKLIRHCVTFDGRKPNVDRLWRAIHLVSYLEFLASIAQNLHRQCQPCGAFIESMCKTSVDAKLITEKLTDELVKSVTKPHCQHLEAAAARAAARILDPKTSGARIVILEDLFGHKDHLS